MEKNYEDINTTQFFVAFVKKEKKKRKKKKKGQQNLRAVSCSLEGGCLIQRRMYLLSINTKEAGTQNKTHVPSCVLLLCTSS